MICRRVVVVAWTLAAKWLVVVDGFSTMTMKDSSSVTMNRRGWLGSCVRKGVVAVVGGGGGALGGVPLVSHGRCTDLESCREIGDLRIEEKERENPTVRLDKGVRYKKLRPGFGADTVNAGANVELIYSISQANGAYMYSCGFGYNKVDLGNGQTTTDAGLDSYRIEALGSTHPSVPVGIELALMGMKQGERRRVEVPAAVGFETSGWEPAPTTRRGKGQIISYRNLLRGNGSTQPAFPAATIWDIEVVRFRNNP